MLSVSVVSKRFPRFGPAESGTGYHEEVSRFAAADVPTPLPVGQSADEVVITFNGRRAEPEAKRHLVDEVNDFLGTAGYAAEWDFRAGTVIGADTSMDSATAFELTVFTSMFGECAREPAD